MNRTGRRAICAPPIVTIQNQNQFPCKISFHLCHLYAYRSTCSCLRQSLIRCSICDRSEPTVTSLRCSITTIFTHSFIYQQHSIQSYHPSHSTHTNLPSINFIFFIIQKTLRECLHRTCHVGAQVCCFNQPFLNSWKRVNSLLNELWIIGKKEDVHRNWEVTTLCLHRAHHVVTACSGTSNYRTTFKKFSKVHTSWNLLKWQWVASNTSGCQRTIVVCVFLSALEIERIVSNSSRLPVA